MELSVTLDLDVIRVEMKPVFTDKYKADWVDQENPTDIELKKSIRDEVNAGLKYLALTFEVKTS
tara:strand:+ start:272 stop:463 length:192 start_codon:yes stop_codon:yes gene_type:complete